MLTEEAKERIEAEDDFVYSARHNFSLKQLLHRYPDGCPDRVIAAVLLMTEDEVEERYQAVVLKFRRQMGVEDLL